MSSSQTNSVHLSVSRSGPWAWAILDPEDCSNDGDSLESGDWISPDADTVIPAPYDLDVGSGTGVAAGCRGTGGQRRGRGRPPGQVGMCLWLCNRYKQEDQEAMATADPKLVLAKAGLDARRKLADAQIVAKCSVDSRSTLGIAPNFLQVTSPLVLQCLQALERADSSKTRRRDWHARMGRWMDLISSGVRRGYMPLRHGNFMITERRADDRALL